MILQLPFYVILCFPNTAKNSYNLKIRLSTTASASIYQHSQGNFPVSVFLLAATRRGNLSARPSAALFYVDQSTVNKCAYNNFICPSEFPRLIRLCDENVHILLFFISRCTPDQAHGV